MPAFNGHALRGYEALVTEVARAEVARWPAGEEFRALDRMNALTLEVILRVVFGVTDEARLAELRPRVNATVDISPAVLLGWGYPRLQRFGPWKRTVRNQERARPADVRRDPRAPRGPRPRRAHRRALAADPGRDAATTGGDAARRHRAARPAGHAAARRPRDHGDGAWPGRCYELGRDPAQLPPRPGGRARRRRRLAGGGAEGVDAAAPGHPDGGPDADCSPATIGGGRPAGRRHRRARRSSSRTRGARTTPSPRSFRPERFLGQNPPTNTWIPFGGGVRRCIGAGLLADGGRRGAARGAHGVRRGGGRRRRAQGPQHHQRPAPRRPDPGDAGRCGYPRRPGIPTGQRDLA